MNRSIQGLMIDKIVALWIVLALHNRTEKEVRKYGNRKMRIPPTYKSSTTNSKAIPLCKYSSFNCYNITGKVYRLHYLQKYLFNPCSIDQSIWLNILHVVSVILLTLTSKTFATAPTTIKQPEHYQEITTTIKHIYIQEYRFPYFKTYQHSPPRNQCRQ